MHVSALFTYITCNKKILFTCVYVWVVLFVNVTFHGKITISYTFIIYSVEFNGLN